MSRSGYSDEWNQDWDWIRWRGAVSQATFGKRGQAFLREMLEALDAMPIRQLIAHELVATPPAFIPPNAATAAPLACAIGVVGLKRKVAMKGIDPEDRYRVATEFGIAPALAAEIVFENDEGAGYWSNEKPEGRWNRMRAWVVSQIREPAAREAIEARDE